MIFYCATEEKLIFYSSFSMNEIGEDIDGFLEKCLSNKNEQYKREAEKFVEKMEELCKSKNNISSQEFSLKYFLDLVIKNYREEMEYIHKLEEKWKHIMIANHIISDEDPAYGCADRISFDYFDDGILSFDVLTDRIHFHFFVPSDFDQTTVKKTYEWRGKYELLAIQEEETALRIVSLLMNDLLNLYKHCEEKCSLYSMMRNHRFPDCIFYQDYAIRITILDKESKIQSVLLKVLMKDIEIVTIDFPINNKTDSKMNFLTRFLLPQDSLYNNYTIITANIRQSKFLSKNLLNVLDRIRIDRKLCDRI